MYDYSMEREKIFTDEGQKMFLKIRDNTFKLIRQSGAVKMGNAISGNIGSSWAMLACVDRLVELEEIREINPGKYRGQDRIFVFI